MTGLSHPWDVALRRFAPRPVLVLHGEDDESVPMSDAKQLADAHGSAELNVLIGAGHRLRHDPRAVGILLGWLDRVRAVQAAASGDDQRRVLRADSTR